MGSIFSPLVLKKKKKIGVRITYLPTIIPYFIPNNVFINFLTNDFRYDCLHLIRKKVIIKLVETNQKLFAVIMIVHFD